jgi:hypothetical protein
LQNHASFHGTVNPRKPAFSKAFQRFHDEIYPHSFTKTLENIGLLLPFICTPEELLGEENE